MGDVRIGEVAQRAGVTIKAVRYYESLGLLNPSRLANGYRDYSDDDARLAREVKVLARLGITAERARPFVDCLNAGHQESDDCPSSLASYRAAIEDLTARIEALTARRKALTQRLTEAAYRGSAFRPGRQTEQTGITSASAGIGPPGELPAAGTDDLAHHLAGIAMPRLALPSTSGEIVSLDALGPDRAVVYLYPLTGRLDTDLPEGWDAIPGARGCTAQACGFRDHHAELAEAGASVLGLSSQGTAYQLEVTGRLRLPFPMLSDLDLRLASLLNLPAFEVGDARFYARLTLIVADGVIEHVFYPVLQPGQHAQQVLAWLQGNRDDI